MDYIAALEIIQIHHDEEIRLNGIKKDPQYFEIDVTREQRMEEQLEERIGINRFSRDIKILKLSNFRINIWSKMKLFEWAKENGKDHNILKFVNGVMEKKKL